MPANRSQASKWTKAVRDRLPEWIAKNVQPLLQTALEHSKVDAKLDIGGAESDKLLHYPAIKQGTGYVAATGTLEFGGRATGEPHQLMPVACDMEGHVDRELSDRIALGHECGAHVLGKGHSNHVYAPKGGSGASATRGWHDLAAIMRSPHFDTACRRTPAPPPTFPNRP